MIQSPFILIFDAMSQVFRAYYAIRGLATSRGTPTNATYGFALMLRRVFEKHPPDYIAMVFDSSEPTARHELYPQYKATRQRMPADLSEQIPDIRRLCAIMRIPIIEISGQEADDVIGSLARRAAEAGVQPVIVTLDKDMMQLVDDNIRILNTSKDDMLVGPREVEELFGVAPRQIPDLLGLWGDTSDNIPGAPGIGAKGACELIRRFGSLEAALDRVAEVTAKRQRESLMEHRDQILLSKQLATIDTDVPLEVEWDSLRFASPDRDLLIEFYREREFTTLLKAELQAEAGATFEVLESQSPPEVERYFAFAPREGAVDIWTGEGPVHRLPLDERLAPLLTDPGIVKTTHNVKAAFGALGERGIPIGPPYDDVMLMAYLLSPNRGKYEIDELVGEFFGESAQSASSAVWIHRLHTQLRPQVRRNLEDLYSRIELPLAPVLAEMEKAGILLDTAALERMSEVMSRQLEALSARIFELAGEQFNIGSPKQLGEVLFDRLNLPRSRKLRKSGQYSTAVEVLEELAEAYELPRLVLEHRQHAKFKSTYIDVLPGLVDEAGRLHTSFNQVGAATGRLSSSEPNLQNIPIRTELGREIRAAFIAPPGASLLSADYSQVELRILAHLSRDEGLVEAFLSGGDIHRSTAAEVLGIPVDQITPEQRSRAKAVNFGLVYGQTPFGLARQLGIGREEAEDFIHRYFSRYPGVRAYIENALAEARECGHTRTLFGRIRQIPEINSRNGMRRSMAERMAINAPIQGAAADIIKLAMIRIAGELSRHGLRTRMLLQVHDELLFEVPDPELDVIESIRRWMSEVAELRVPLVVDLKTGRNWRDLTPKLR